MKDYQNAENNRENHKESDVTNNDTFLFYEVNKMFSKVTEDIYYVGVNDHQIDLFEDTIEMMSLYQAMDNMKKRFGFDAVMRCAGATLKTKKNVS